MAGCPCSTRGSSPPGHCAGLITQTVFWCQQAAGYLVIGLYLQQGRGLSPLAAGAVFTFLAAGYLITSFQAPALTVASAAG